jgi:hypothetical protein
LTSIGFSRTNRNNLTTRSQGRHPTRTSKNRLFDKEIVADPTAPALQIWYQLLAIQIKRAAHADNSIWARSQSRSARQHGPAPLRLAPDGTASWVCALLPRGSLPFVTMPAGPALALVCSRPGTTTFKTLKQHASTSPVFRLWKKTI